MAEETQEKKNLEKFIQHGFTMFSTTLQNAKSEKDALNLSVQSSVVSNVVGGVAAVVTAVGLHYLSMGGANQVAVAAAKKGQSMSQIVSDYFNSEKFDKKQTHILSWIDDNDTQFLRTVAEGLTYICIAFKDQIDMFHYNNVNNDIFFKDVFRRVFNYMKNHRRNKSTPLDSKEIYNAFINGRSTLQGYKEQINALNLKNSIRGLDLLGKDNQGKLNTENLFEASGLIKYDPDANEDIKLIVHKEADSGKSWTNQDFRLQFTFEVNVLDDKKRIGIPCTILDKNALKIDIKKDWRLNVEKVETFVQKMSRKLNMKKELRTKWWPKSQNIPNTFYERKFKNQDLFEKMKQILSGQNKVSQNPDRKDCLKNKVVLFGFVGVGKTVIAKRYAQMWAESYEHIIWIDCTEDGGRKSFTSLLQTLQIQNCDIKNLDLVISCCFNALKNFFCLWIFDNAKGYNCQHGIKDVLPEKNENFDVIITSRSKDWGTEFLQNGIVKFEINPFTDVEALDFMKINLGQLKFNEPKMVFLIQQLGNLPLALHIALKFLVEKKKTLSELIEMIKGKAGIIEESFDDYSQTIKNAMQVYLSAIDPENIRKEELACKMLSYFGYIRPDEVDIGFFKSVVDIEIVNGVKLLEDYSLVTKSAENTNYSIHRLMQLVIRHNTENEKRDEIIANILSCKSYIDYKLLPYFFSGPELRNKFPNIKSELISGLNLEKLFVNRKYEEAELLSRLIYDSSPPTYASTYNYALCLQFNQDAYDAIVLLEHLYDNCITIPTHTTIHHTDKQKFGVISSQDTPCMEILAGQLFLSYFNNNSNEETKINKMIQNCPVIFQFKYNNLGELTGFLTLNNISDVLLRYDGKTNCASLHKFVGKKLEISNCRITELNYLLNYNLQELELCKVNIPSEIFQLLNNYGIRKLIFRNTTVDMSYDLTVEEVTLERVEVLSWNKSNWIITTLNLKNINFLEQTKMEVKNLTIWNSTVDTSVLPVSLIKVTLNECIVQPVISCSPVAFKYPCPLLQECSFQSVTFKEKDGKSFTEFDISYSIGLNFFNLQKLTLDCSTKRCTKLLVSIDCLCSIDCLVLNGCQLILSSHRLCPKELTLTHVEIIDEIKHRTKNILVNFFTDFSQMQKLSLEGMAIELSNNCPSSPSVDYVSHLAFSSELQELTLKNITLSDEDTNMDRLDISSSIFNYLNLIKLQGNTLSVSLKYVNNISNIHLSDCAVIVLITEDLKNNYVKPTPHNLTLENVTFLKNYTEEISVPILNELFDFCKIKKLILHGPLSIDLKDEFTVDEVWLKSVKVLNWKDAKWRINKLTLENVNTFEKSRISVQELIIDGQVHLRKPFYRKLVEEPRSQSEKADTIHGKIVAGKDFSVTAMGALKIKKILLNYADLEQKWKTVPESLDLSEKVKEEINHHGGGFGSIILKTLTFWRHERGHKAMFNDMVTVIRNNAEHTLAADRLLEQKEEVRLADVLFASPNNETEFSKHELKKIDRIETSIKHSKSLTPVTFEMGSNENTNVYKHLSETCSSNREIATNALHYFSHDRKENLLCKESLHSSVLQDYLGVPKAQVLWSHVNDDLIEGFVSLFDQILELKQEMEIVFNQIKTFQYCISNQDFGNAVKMRDQLLDIDLTLRSELRKILLQPKSENTEIDKLIALRSKYGTENQNLKKSEEFIRNKGGNLAIKIDLAKRLQENGVDFLKREETVYTAILNCNHHLYIIYVNKEAKSDEINEQLGLMLGIQQVAALMGSTSQKVELLFVDCEIHKEYASDDKPVRISHISNKKTLSEDVYNEMKNISIAGVYILSNNGNYGEFLTEIGLPILKYYYVVNATPKVTITENNNCYEIKIETSLKNAYETIRPGDTKGSKTLDGYDAISRYELVANSLIQTEELSGVPQDKKIRKTIRTFTKDEMKVTLIANNITATRVFKRIA